MTHVTAQGQTDYEQVFTTALKTFEKRGEMTASEAAELVLEHSGNYETMARELLVLAFNRGGDLYESVKNTYNAELKRAYQEARAEETRQVEKARQQE